MMFMSDTWLSPRLPDTKYLKRRVGLRQGRYKHVELGLRGPVSTRGAVEIEPEEVKEAVVASTIIDIRIIRLSALLGDCTISRIHTIVRSGLNDKLGRLRLEHNDAV